MERLTETKIDIEKFSEKAKSRLTKEYIEKVKLNNKLFEFEDFMEEQGFESLEDLKNALLIKLPEERVKEIAKKSIKDFLLSQEFQKEINNLALYKAMWQKLKEWITSFEKFLEEEKVEYAMKSGIYITAKLIPTESLKLKIEKLEKEIK